MLFACQKHKLDYTNKKDLTTIGGAFFYFWRSNNQENQAGQRVPVGTISPFWYLPVATKPLSLSKKVTSSQYGRIAYNASNRRSTSFNRKISWPCSLAALVTRFVYPPERVVSCVKLTPAETGFNLFNRSLAALVFVPGSPGGFAMFRV